MKTELHILCIVGSPRRESRVAAGITALDNAITRLGAVSQVWNLGQRPLPFMIPELRANECSIENPELVEFLNAAQAADAYIFGSPVYHNSYSGVLKNAIDHLSMRHVGGKAFALASHGGNRSSQAVDHLRIVVRSLEGIAIPTQLCTDECDFEFDETGKPILASEMIFERVKRLAQELVEFAAMLRGRRESSSKSKNTTSHQHTPVLRNSAQQGERP